MTSKKLYRIPEKGMIGGVCAGLAGYLATDVTIVRLIFAFLALAGSSGVWIYLIMWLIVPLKPSGTNPDPVEADVESPEDVE
jgi:phage shock protein C